MKPDAAAIGRRVLEELERGRTIANERAQERAVELRAAVERLAREDALRFGERGRAGRIAIRLGRVVGERHVRKILATLVQHGRFG